MTKKTKTVKYEITYQSWMERPPFRSKHIDKLVATDDADAINQFNHLKTEYERCENFKLTKITRERLTTKHSSLSETVTVITRTQLA